MQDKMCKIVYELKFGRQLIAERNIKAGECIINEPPIIHGPGYSTSILESCTGENTSTNGNEKRENHQKTLIQLKDINVCIVCYQNISLADNNIPTKCDKCSIYMCSRMCCLNATHRQNECKIFQKLSPAKLPNLKTMFDLIATIRSLFCRSRDKVKWKQITSLQSKWEELENIGAFTTLTDIFSSFKWEMFEDEGFREESTVNKEDIIWAAKHSLGVMRINAFSHFSATWNREGLYFLSAFMSHNCMMNTDRQMDQDGKMIVRAAVDIQKGQPITTSYVTYLNNTAMRNRELKNNWLFTCDCKRCLDHTECDTCISHICCPNCHKTKLYPLLNSSLDHGESQVWKCGNSFCNAIVPNFTAVKIIQLIEDTKPKSNDSIKLIEDWLRTYDSNNYLHTNHSIFVQAKFHLCQLYGRDKEAGSNSLQQLCRKAELCIQLNNILKSLYPGIYQFRGIILFELWSSLSHIILNPKEPYLNLENFIHVNGWSERFVHEVKNEAKNILKYACPNSAEESMALVLEETD